MKEVVIKFTVGSEENENDVSGEVTCALHGRELASILWDLDMFLREHLKHVKHTEDEYVVYQAVRDKLHDLVNDNDCNSLSNLIFNCA